MNVAYFRAPTIFAQQLHRFFLLLLCVFVSVCLFVMQVTCLKQICATSTDLVNIHSTQLEQQLKQQLDIVKSIFVKNDAREANVIFAQELREGTLAIA